MLITEGKRQLLNFLLTSCQRPPGPAGPPRHRCPHPGTHTACQVLPTQPASSLRRTQGASSPAQQPRPGPRKETRRRGSGLQHPQRSAWQPAAHRSSFWCPVTTKGPLARKQRAPATETETPTRCHTPGTAFTVTTGAPHSLPLPSPRVAPLAAPPRGVALVPRELRPVSLALALQ